jgi:hypothetical protein
VSLVGHYKKVIKKMRLMKKQNTRMCSLLLESVLLLKESVSLVGYDKKVIVCVLSY